jgi:hypothetical protein
LPDHTDPQAWPLVCPAPEQLSPFCTGELISTVITKDSLCWRKSQEGSVKIFMDEMKTFKGL